MHPEVEWWAERMTRAAREQDGWVEKTKLDHDLVGPARRPMRKVAGHFGGASEWPLATGKQRL